MTRVEREGEGLYTVLWDFLFFEGGEGKDAEVGLIILAEDQGWARRANDGGGMDQRGNGKVENHAR